MSQKEKERDCCSISPDSSYCKKISYYKYPDEKCTASFCKNCFKSCNADEITCVLVRIDDSSQSTNDSEFDDDEDNSIVSNDSLNRTYEIDDNIGIGMFPTEDEEENQLFVNEITTDEMDEYVTAAEMAEYNE